MTIKFLDAGTNGFFTLDSWDSTVGGISSSTDAPMSGPRSTKISPAGAVATASFAVATMTIGRGSCTFRHDGGTITSVVPAFPAMLRIYNGSSNICRISINSAYKLCIVANNVEAATGTTVLAAGNPYKVAFSWNITSTTVNSFTVWLNGVVEITATNITLSNASPIGLGLGCASSITGTINYYVGDIYFDDDSSGAYPGNIFVTAKFPNGLGSSNAWQYQPDSSITRWVAAKGSRPVSAGLAVAATDKGIWDFQTSSAYELFAVDGSAEGDYPSDCCDVIGYKTMTYAGALPTSFPSTNAGIAQVGQQANGNSSAAANSVSATIGPVFVNDLILVCVVDAMGGTTPTISDDPVNSYTSLGTGAVGALRGTFFYAKANATQSSLTVTANFGNSNASLKDITIQSVYDLLFGGIGALDKAPALASGGGSNTVSFTATGTLSQANELVFGLTAIDSVGTSNAWTALKDMTSVGSSNQALFGGAVVASTASVGPQVTKTGAVTNYLSCTVTFPISGSMPSTTSRFLSVAGNDYNISVPVPSTASAIYAESTPYTSSVYPTDLGLGNNSKNGTVIKALGLQMAAIHSAVTWPFSHLRVGDKMSRCDSAT